MPERFPPPPGAARRPRPGGHAPLRRAAPMAGWFALLMLLPGCTVILGHRDLRHVNDELRAENMDLRERVEGFGEQVAGLERLLEVERERREVELPPGVQPPTIARVAIARYSGPIDTTSDEAPDAVRLYLRTFDARGRFTQAVADIHVTVAATRPGEAAATVATASFDARTLDGAYRSGFTGTHYTLEVPFEEPLPPDSTSISVHVALEDLQTGYTHRADANFPVTAAGRATGTADLAGD